MTGAERVTSWTPGPEVELPAVAGVPGLPGVAGVPGLLGVPGVAGGPSAYGGPPHAPSSPLDSRLPSACTAGPRRPGRPGGVLMGDGNESLGWALDPVGTAVGRATRTWPRPLRWRAATAAEVAGWWLWRRVLDLVLRRWP